MCVYFALKFPEEGSFFIQCWGIQGWMACKLAYLIQCLLHLSRHVVPTSVLLIIKGSPQFIEVMGLLRLCSTHLFLFPKVIARQQVDLRRCPLNEVNLLWYVLITAGDSYFFLHLPLDESSHFRGYAYHRIYITNLPLIIMRTKLPDYRTVHWRLNWDFYWAGSHCRCVAGLPSFNVVKVNLHQ